MPVTRSVRRPPLTSLADAVAPALGLLPDGNGVPVQVDVDQARRHGVLAMIEWPAAAGVRSAVVAPAAQEAREQNLESYVRAVADVRIISGALGPAGIPWAVLKGPELAAGLYPRPHLRAFTDIDVVVPPSAFRHVLEALEQVGGVVLVRNWEYMATVRPAEVAVRLPAGSLLDLHWHLVNDPRERFDFPLSAEVLLSSAVPSALTPAGCTADLILTFLHLAWHATHSGCARLLWACDIELASRRIADVDRCIEAADGLGLRLAVEIALAWTGRLFPRGRAADLSAAWPRSRWGALAARSLALGQDGRFGRRSGQSLAGWTMSTSGRSAVALMRAFPRILRPADREEEELWLGGDPSREAYLHAVELQGRAPGLS
jgi:hypothetical protein